VKGELPGLAEGIVFDSPLEYTRVLIVRKLIIVKQQTSILHLKEMSSDNSRYYGRAEDRKINIMTVEVDFMDKSWASRSLCLRDSSGVAGSMDF
jgi:hypothetical protein